MSVTALRPRDSHQRRVQAPPPAPAAAPGRARTPRTPGLPARTPLHHAVAGLRLSGHWRELLADLALLGALRLELATARVRLVDRVCLAGLRVDGTLASLHSAEQSLRLLLARCHALSAAPARDALLLEDDLGRPLLRLYDADGRALAIIAVARTCTHCCAGTGAAPCSGEPRFWRSLMNALTA